MQVKFNPEPLPPDHPIFTRGVSFVFRSDLPEAKQDESDDAGKDQQPSDE